MGSVIPNFIARTQLGRIDFHDYVAGGWGFIMSFTRMYDAVSLTELGMLAKLAKQFSGRNVNILCIAPALVSQVEVYTRDVDIIEDTRVTYPIAQDPEGRIARKLGLWKPHAKKKKSTIMSAWMVIDPFKRVRMRESSSHEIGRNLYEVLRMIDAIQLTERHPILTGADWKQGDQVLIPMNTPVRQFPHLYPRGTNAVTDYQRFTPDPEYLNEDSDDDT